MWSSLAWATTVAAIRRHNSVAPNTLRNLSESTVPRLQNDSVNVCILCMIRSFRVQLLLPKNQESGSPPLHPNPLIVWLAMCAPSDNRSPSSKSLSSSGTARPCPVSSRTASLCGGTFAHRDQPTESYCRVRLLGMEFFPRCGF